MKPEDKAWIYQVQIWFEGDWSTIPEKKEFSGKIVRAISLNGKKEEVMVKGENIIWELEKKLEIRESTQREK